MSRYLLLDRVFSRHHFEYQDDLSDEVVLSQTKQKCGQTSVHCTTTSVLSAQGGFLFTCKLMAIGIKNILCQGICCLTGSSLTTILNTKMILGMRLCYRKQNKNVVRHQYIAQQLLSAQGGFLFMCKLMAIGIKNILFGDHI